MAGETKAALIAGGSSLIGAIVGGLLTYVVAHATIVANKQQAVDTFLLTQRQVAFATFLTDAEDFNGDQYSYSAVSGSSRKSLGSMIAADTRRLDADYNTVSLVDSSPPSISSAAQEASTLSSLIAIKEGLVETTMPQPAGSTIQSLTSQFDDDLTKLRSEMNSVILKG
jgi:hypothetical protein